MKVVLGIGNPGRKYSATRHNVGFRVIDRVAGALGVEVRKRKLKGLLGEGAAEGERLLLVKSQTYVNLTGECARAVLDYFGAGVDSLLVVTDDVNLPLGALRCRGAGSSGGHNGLESVIRHLGTQEFARLRVGVGRPEGETGETSSSTTCWGALSRRRRLRPTARRRARPRPSSCG